MKLQGEVPLNGAECSDWEELLEPTAANVLASYDNPAWNGYAAVTENTYGKGKAWYLGCYFSPAHLKKFVKDVIAKDLPAIRPYKEKFPLIIRTGYNAAGHKLTYYLNYSAKEQRVHYKGREATELTSGQSLAGNDTLTLAPWGLQIVETK
jgi:beta-galactosidase